MWMDRSSQKNATIINIAKLLLLCCCLVSQLWGQAADSISPIKEKRILDYRLKDNKRLLQKKTVLEYNIYGNLVQQSFYKGEQLQRAEHFKYDRLGQLVGRLRYDSMQALIWSEDRQLDKEGRKLKVTQTAYRPPGFQQQYTLYSYSSGGKIKQVQTYNTEDQLVSEVNYLYSQLGELLGSNAWDLQEDGRKRSLSILHEYNKKGQIQRSVSILQNGKDRYKEVRNFENCFIIEWQRYQNGILYSHFKHDKEQIREQGPSEIPPPLPFQLSPLDYEESRKDPLRYTDYQPLRSINTKNNEDGLPIKEAIREGEKLVEVRYFFYDEAKRLIRRKTVDKVNEEVKEEELSYTKEGLPLTHRQFLDKKLIQERSYEYIYYPN